MFQPMRNAVRLPWLISRPRSARSNSPSGCRLQHHGPTSDEVGMRRTCGALRIVVGCNITGPTSDEVGMRRNLTRTH
jgi:hypothetical protein